MTSQLEIRDASGWTIFIFGLLAFLFGLISLIRPELLLSTLGFTALGRTSRAAGDYTLVFILYSCIFNGIVQCGRLLYARLIV